MKNPVIAFPGPGLEFTLNRVAISIGSFEILWYGVVIGLGFLLAVLYALHRAKDFSLTKDNIYDLVIFAAPIAILGARTYYILGDPDVSFLDFLKIRDGGLAIYGAVIGGALAALLVSKIKKLNLFDLLDVGGLGLLIGQSIGRLGNFFNIEVYGRETKSFLRMVLPNGTAVHPLFLYEILWNVLGFVLLHCYSKHRKFKGELFCLYLVWYGLCRALLESLRDDTFVLRIAGQPLSLILSLLLALASAALIIFMRLRLKKASALAADEKPPSEPKLPCEENESTGD